jgi:hypothetical protein
MSKQEMKAFASIQNKGFRMTFKNGITASIQFGPANYCNARSYAPDSYNAPMKTENGCWDSETAEVAAWDKNGNWVTKKVLPGINDDVDGWQTTDDVLMFLNFCAKL